MQVVLQVGSTVFVHAGVLPEHARYGLERMNTCVSLYHSATVSDIAVQQPVTHCKCMLKLLQRLPVQLPETRGSG